MQPSPNMEALREQTTWQRRSWLVDPSHAELREISNTGLSATLGENTGVKWASSAWRRAIMHSSSRHNVPGLCQTRSLEASLLMPPTTAAMRMAPTVAPRAPAHLLLVDRGSVTVCLARRLVFHLVALKATLIVLVHASNSCKRYPSMYCRTWRINACIK